VSKSVSPITGKWRVETVAVNKPVTICGVAVNPGDVVLADETGVCFVPRERAAEVLARAQHNAASEKLRDERIASGVPIADLIGKPK
jgi:regulator of RNase E activity RraA